MKLSFRGRSLNKLQKKFPEQIPGGAGPGENWRGGSRASPGAGSGAASGAGSAASFTIFFLQQEGESASSKHNMLELLGVVASSKPQ